MRNSKEEREIKLNLGCGTHVVNGWVNVDKSFNVIISKVPLLKWLLYHIGLMSEIAYKASWDKLDAKVLRRDVTKGLPYKENEIDCIYSAHMLEHLSRKDALFVLKECYRVLKGGGGGILRLVLPDLHFYCKKYVVRDEDYYYNEEPIADQLIKKLHFSVSDERNPLEKLFSNYHLWNYDFESISYYLLKAGFENINREKLREGKLLDLEKVEPHWEDSIFVEAIK